ncbi:MAG TPA: hypothetical protein VFL80_07150 [Thermoanaerobaculia bacterium]|nr:hypothetical protein [Thermoanaerobaculia bacterium]
MTKDQIYGLAKQKRCPRCDLEKTQGSAICRSCRSKLPTHMRAGLEAIPNKDAWTVGHALRAAANYFDVHFRSIRAFGGGRKRR